MQKTNSWREVLEVILKDPVERQCVTKNLHISNFTLWRWIRGEETPSVHQVQRLLRALPRHQAELLPLIAEEFEEGKVSILEQVEIPEDIPSIFYAQVLRGSTAIPSTIRFWSLASMVLQQALMQIDYQRKGVLLRVATFLPPNADGKLYCLREAVSLGTDPWEGNCMHSAILLGAESLAGQAIGCGRPLVAGRQEEDEYGDSRENEMSRLAFPIMRCNDIAGALLVSSSQEKYFTPERLLLCHRYTDLLAMAFESADFYAPELLALSSMPTPLEQKERLVTFRNRVASTLTREGKGQHIIDTTQAELLVWQQFADEFLRYTS